MNMRRRAFWLGSLILFVSVPSLAFDKPGFPRLAGTLIGSPAIYADANYQAQMAKLNVITINAWPGWSADMGNGTTLEQAVSAIKKINPNELVFEYVILEQLGAQQGLTAPYLEQYNKVVAANWWVYTQGSSGTRVLSSWQGGGGPFYEINLTSYAPPDSNGDRWTDWFAKYDVRTFLTPAPSLDGIYTDSVSWKPEQASDGDWNRDGTADSSSNPTVQQWYRLGYQHYFQTLRSLAPSKFLIANIADWGDYSSTLTEYQGLLNGGIIEAIVGMPYSPETFGGFSGALSWYRKTMAALADPKLAFFMQVGSATDYQAMRYGLTLCMMDDGYYNFAAVAPGQTNPDYHTIAWFDEFSVALGQATTSPPTSAWQQGVYRRDFQNGIALVNPKGNGPKTVTLEADFRKISGTQASNINNGQTVRTVSLADRDGIILLRTQAQSVTPPASPTNVIVK